MEDFSLLKRILVFDDDEDQRKLILTHLGKMFDSVEIEQYDPLVQGAPAENFDWSRYDVLILDYFLCLHGVTGLDIVHKNRNNPAFPATIMLTGAGNEEIAMRALKEGIYAYIRKQTLKKEELRTSILNAFEKHKQAKKNRVELTLQGGTFNKELFYQQLEYKKEDPEFRNRTLFLIELNDHEAIEERAGIILRDNIVRHIARQSYEVFKLGECNPKAIRIGDYSIALLIDAPDSRKTLEFNLNGLINHLKKRPYKFGDAKFRFTISIGVVTLSGKGDTADTVLQYAKLACAIASEAEDNAYHIHDDNENAIIKPASTGIKADKIVPPETPDVAPIPAVIKSALKSEGNPPAETKTSPASSETENNLIEVPVARARTEINRTQEPEIHIDFEPVPEPAATKPAASATQPAPVKPVTKPANKPEATTNVTTAVPPTAQVKPVEKPVTRQDVASSKPAVAQGSQPQIVQDKNSAKTILPTVDSKQPKKSVSELKANFAQPNKVQNTPASPAPTTTKPAEAELDVSDLDESGRNLKTAFDEKRVVQLYQPIISLMTEETDSEDEIYKVSLRLIDKDGTIKTAAQIKSLILLPAFKKYVDRWLLREMISRLANAKDNKHTYILDISDASLADANFFNWLRKLLTGLDSINPGKFTTLEIDAKHLVSLEKQANALITYLRKTHNFKFILGNIDNVTEILQFASRIQFDFIRCDNQLIRELYKNSPATKTEDKLQFQKLKSTGVRIIADNIGDATTLTEIISWNTEYAMGELIGEPAAQMEDVTNIETFEII